MVAAAVIGAAVVGGVATTSAASKASKAQTNAANAANQVAIDHYNQIRSDLSPYNTAGQKALASANTYLNGYGTSGAAKAGQAVTGYLNGYGTSDAFKAGQVANNLITGAGGSQQAALAQTPGYQFALSQGLRAVGNKAAGSNIGGAYGRGLANFATGLANQTYGDQVNRSIANAELQNSLFGDQYNRTVSNAQLQNQLFGDQYNRFLGQAQLGENAAAQTGSYGVQTANTVGNNLTAAGNAKAANQIANGNAIASIGSSIPNAMVYNNIFGSGNASSAGSGGMYSLTMPSFNSSTIPGGWN